MSAEPNGVSPLPSITVQRDLGLRPRQVRQLSVPPVVCVLLLWLNFGHPLFLPTVLVTLAVIAATVLSVHLGRPSSAYVKLTPRWLVLAPGALTVREVPWPLIREVVPVLDPPEVQVLVHDPLGIVNRGWRSPNRLGDVRDPWVLLHIPTPPLATDPASLAILITDHWQSAL